MKKICWSGMSCKMGQMEELRTQLTTSCLGPKLWSAFTFFYSVVNRPSNFGGLVWVTKWTKWRNFGAD